MITALLSTCYYLYITIIDLWPEQLYYNYIVIAFVICHFVIVSITIIGLA